MIKTLFLITFMLLLSGKGHQIRKLEVYIKDLDSLNTNLNIDNNEINLLSSITTKSPLNPISNKITLDLNGYSITFNYKSTKYSKSYGFKIESTGQLTIINTNETMQSTIKGPKIDTFSHDTVFQVLGTLNIINIDNPLSIIIGDKDNSTYTSSHAITTKDTENDQISPAKLTLKGNLEFYSYSEILFFVNWVTDCVHAFDSILIDGLSDSTGIIIGNGKGSSDGITVCNGDDFELKGKVTINSANGIAIGTQAGLVIGGDLKINAYNGNGIKIEYSDSETKPFYLNGNIISSGSTYGLLIDNVDATIEISNRALFKGGDYGMFVESSNNLLLKGNISAAGNIDGIRIYSTESTTVEAEITATICSSTSATTKSSGLYHEGNSIFIYENIISSGFKRGVYLLDSEATINSQNDKQLIIITDNYQGLFVKQSSKVNVQGKVQFSGPTHGVFLKKEGYNPYVLFTNKNIQFISDSGVEIVVSSETDKQFALDKNIGEDLGYIYISSEDEDSRFYKPSSDPPDITVNNADTISTTPIKEILTDGATDQSPYYIIKWVTPFTAYYYYDGFSLIIETNVEISEFKFVQKDDVNTNYRTLSDTDLTLETDTRCITTYYYKTCTFTESDTNKLLGEYYLKSKIVGGTEYELNDKFLITVKKGEIITNIQIDEETYSISKFVNDYYYSKDTEISKIILTISVSMSENAFEITNNKEKTFNIGLDANDNTKIIIDASSDKINEDIIFYINHKTEQNNNNKLHIGYYHLDSVSPTDIDLRTVDSTVKITLKYILSRGLNVKTIELINKDTGDVYQTFSHGNISEPTIILTLNVNDDLAKRSYQFKTYFYYNDITFLCEDTDKTINIIKPVLEFEKITLDNVFIFEDTDTVIFPKGKTLNEITIEFNDTLSIGRIKYGTNDYPSISDTKFAISYSQIINANTQLDLEDNLKYDEDGNKVKYEINITFFDLIQVSPSKLIVEDIGSFLNLTYNVDWTNQIKGIKLMNSTWEKRKSFYASTSQIKLHKSDDLCGSYDIKTLVYVTSDNDDYNFVSLSVEVFKYLIIQKVNIDGVEYTNIEEILIPKNQNINTIKITFNDKIYQGRLNMTESTNDIIYAANDNLEITINYSQQLNDKKIFNIKDELDLNTETIPLQFTIEEIDLVNIEPSEILFGEADKYIILTYDNNIGFNKDKIILYKSSSEEIEIDNSNIIKLNTTSYRITLKRNDNLEGEYYIKTVYNNQKYNFINNIIRFKITNCNSLCKECNMIPGNCTDCYKGKGLKPSDNANANTCKEIEKEFRAENIRDEAFVNIDILNECIKKNEFYLKRDYFSIGCYLYNNSNSNNSSNFSQTNNITVIDLGEDCTGKFKDESKLYIYEIEDYSNNGEKSVDFKLFNEEGTSLDLGSCNETKLTIKTPIDDISTYLIYDETSDLYKSGCIRHSEDANGKNIYSSVQNGKEIIYKQIFIDKGCEFKGINKNDKVIETLCDVKTFIEKNNNNSLNEKEVVSLPNEKKFINSNILGCYNEVLYLDYIKYNYGLYAEALLLIIYLINFIIYLKNSKIILGKFILANDKINGYKNHLPAIGESLSSPVKKTNNNTCTTNVYAETQGRKKSESYPLDELKSKRDLGNNLKYPKSFDIYKNKYKEQSFIKIYFDKFKECQPILRFICKNDENIRNVSIASFIFIIETQLTTNAFFFEPENVHSLKFNFMKILISYSAGLIICIIINLFAVKLIFSDSEQSNGPFSYYYHNKMQNAIYADMLQRKTYSKKIRKYLAVYFSLSSLISIFYLYFCSVFCSIYPINQISWLLSSVIAISLVWFSQL